MTEECDTKLTSWCGVSHRNTGSRSLPEKVSSRNLSNHSSVKADVGKPRWNKAHSMHGFTPSQAGRRDVKLTQMVSCTRRKVGMAFTFGTARAIVESSFMPLSCRCSHDAQSQSATNGISSSLRHWKRAAHFSLGCRAKCLITVERLWFGVSIGGKKEGPRIYHNRPLLEAPAPMAPLSCG